MTPEQEIETIYPFLRSYDFFEELYDKMVSNYIQMLFFLPENVDRTIVARRALKKSIEELDIKKICEETDISIVNMMTYLASISIN